MKMSSPLLLMVTQLVCAPVLAIQQRIPAPQPNVHSVAHKKSKTSSKSKERRVARGNLKIGRRLASRGAAARAKPNDFVEARVQKVLNDLNSRPVRAVTVMTRSELDPAANKVQFLQSLYSRNLVDASWDTEMLSDKLIMSKILERELGSRAKIYYPKTLGLREFLSKHGFVTATGELVRDQDRGDRIESALQEEFPAGFVVRPAVGIAPTETGRGMFQEGDQFIVELLKPDSVLYSPQHLRQPVVSHILNDVASGEAVVLQENVVSAADAHKPLKHHFYQEVRIHTLEGRVVDGAIPERWTQRVSLSAEQAKAAEAFVADFLKSLPPTLLNRQAWGVDVAVVDSGEMRIVDIVTNRGKFLPWSTYLDQPRVLGAYARHIESYYGIKFAGISGSLLRHNFGNYFAYWGKRIDKARPGVDHVLAYLPPFP